MQIDTTNETVTETNAEDMERIVMGFSEEALPHLTHMFTSLYNNPEEAVYRETLFNAIDATHEAGSEKPVIVYIPTYATPILTIEDNGVGMSYDLLKSVVSQFGMSTKRKGDLVGGFGLGFKAPLSITPQFTVDTVKDGQRVVATVSNSEDGIARMDILIREETDSDNGTTVSIPVKEPRKFVEIAQMYTTYVPKGVVLYRNTETYYREFSETHYTDLPKVSEGLYLRKVGYRGLTVVMGGVPYRVSVDDIENNLPEIQEFIVSNMILEVPMSSIKLSPNREGIQFNSKTKETINNLIVNNFVEDIYKAKESIENSTTLMEAIEVYKALPQGLLSVLSRMREIKWEQFSVNTTYLRVADKEESSRPFRLIMGGESPRFYDRIWINQKQYIIENDTQQKRGSITSSIRKYFEKNDISWDGCAVIDPDGRELEVYESSAPLLSELKRLGIEHEVLKISDVLEDIQGWKRKTTAPKKERVKYFDREVMYIDFSTKNRTNEVMGNVLSNQDHVVVMEYRQDKSYNIHPAITKELIDKYLEETFGIEDVGVPGMIVLMNNSKADVFLKNLEKSDYNTKAYVIESSAVFVEYYHRDLVNDILSSKISIQNAYQIHSYKNFGHIVEELINNPEKITDENIVKILGNPEDNISEEYLTYLRNCYISDTDNETVKKYQEMIIESVPEEFRKYGEMLEYGDIKRMWAEYARTVVEGYLEDTYPLLDKWRVDDSIEYMNAMVDYRSN